MIRNTRKFLFFAATLLLLTCAVPSWAGSIFVSGHDSDFHAVAGNTLGAQNIINAALNYTRDGDAKPILVIQTDLSNLGLGDHLDSVQGLINSGYTAGTTNGNHYVVVDAAAFATVNLSDYSALFIPSDHGGTLTEGDLTALDARATDIIAYLNSGGGLVAFAEDGFHTGGSSAQLFGFLPFLVSSTSFQQAETGNTLTAEGVNLGLATSDINGNFSHNIFTSTGGMTVVDQDANGNILSLDWRGTIGIHGVPEPSSLALLGVGLAAMVGTLRRRRS